LYVISTKVPSLCAYANELKASSDGQHEHSTIVYLLHHAKETRTINVLGKATTTYNVEWSGNAVNITSTDGSTVGSNYNDACRDSSCAKELSSLGLLKAELLGGWYIYHFMIMNTDNKNLV
jgi:hypothetical protein